MRLFEAAACGVPVISDRWPGIETFLEPGREILIADTTDDVINTIGTLAEAQRGAIAAASRARVLRSQTADQRAMSLEAYYREARAVHASRRGIDEGVEAVA